MQKGCMVICQNAEAVHGKQKVGNPCTKILNLECCKYARMSVHCANVLIVLCICATAHLILEGTLMADVARRLHC